jgi:hypothetical protein
MGQQGLQSASNEKHILKASASADIGSVNEKKAKDALKSKEARGGEEQGKERVA